MIALDISLLVTILLLYCYCLDIDMHVFIITFNKHHNHTAEIVAHQSTGKLSLKVNPPPKTRIQRNLQLLQFIP